MDTQNVVDTGDGGWGSRKMVQTFVMMGLVLAGYLVIARWSTLGEFYTAFIGGILTVGGMYHGANLVGKHVLGKQALQALGGDDPETPAPPAPKV